MKVTHSCSYTKSISNAISSFFNNKKMNTINQSHLNNVNLVINAWEILIIKSSNSHKKDWGLCCILIICETWVFFSTLARSFSIGVLVLMTYKHSSMIVQMSFCKVKLDINVYNVLNANCYCKQWFCCISSMVDIWKSTSQALIILVFFHPFTIMSCLSFIFSQAWCNHS